MEKATAELRNELARVMFKHVRVNDNRVEAVIPQPDFAPFFVLNCQGRGLSCGSDGLRDRVIKPAARVPLLLIDVIEKARTTIPPTEWSELVLRYNNGESLRELANCYGVSHEAIRGIVQRAS